MGGLRSGRKETRKRSNGSSGPCGADPRERGSTSSRQPTSGQAATTAGFQSSRRSAVYRPARAYMDHLKSKIRHVPDFPKPGILFYDITTLLQDPVGFRDAIDSLSQPFAGKGI